MRTLPLAAVGLLLIFAATRLMALGTFPVFMDEGFFGRLTELTAQTSPFAYASEGRLFTLWWYALFQPYNAELLWVMRAATVLGALPGFAAIIATGRLLAGWQGALLSGLFGLLSAYHLFLQRLALADPVSTSFVLVALYFALRLTRRVNLWDALLSGLALFVAIGAKVSALPFLVIPICAALLLHPLHKRPTYPIGQRWRDNLRWLGTSLAASLGPLMALAAALALRGYGYIDQIVTQAQRTGGLPGIIDNIVTNLAQVSATAAHYMGPIVVGLCALAVLILIWRGDFFLPICLIVPLTVFLMSEKQHSRYYMSVISLLLLCGAVVLARMVRQRGLLMAGTAALVLAWGAQHAGAMAQAVFAAPDTISLSAADYREYIASESSGFGLSAALQTLREHGAREVIGLFANCQGLRFEAMHLRHVMTVTCPRLNPSGEDIEALSTLLMQTLQNRREGVFVVYEPLAFVPASVPGRLIAVVQRPGGVSALYVYALEP